MSTWGPDQSDWRTVGYLSNSGDTIYCRDCAEREWQPMDVDDDGAITLGEAKEFGYKCESCRVLLSSPSRWKENMYDTRTGNSFD